MKKSLLLICVMLLNVAVFSSCSKEDEGSVDSELLIGRWHLESKDSDSPMLDGGAEWIEFLGSGDYFTADGEGGSWSLKGDKLKAVPVKGVPFEYTVLELTGDRLKMQVTVNLGGENLTMTLVYVH